MESVLQRIGNTPLVTLQEQPARVVAKLEWASAGGSVKDRAAVYMLRQALRRGFVAPRGRVVEPTSGNTGIGLAWAAAALGLQLVLVMPEDTPASKRCLAQQYGAQILLTPASEGMAGAVARAEKLSGYHPRQFENPANPQAHLETTGPELWRQAGWVDAFVCATGSGGTLMGVAQYLHRQNDQVLIIAVDPAPGDSIPGIGPNFRPRILREELVGEHIQVSAAAAESMAARAAKQWGIAPGPSGGANLVAAFALAQRQELRGKTVATVLPDSMERYR